MATNSQHGDHMKEDGVISDELNTAEIICVIGKIAFQQLH